MDPMEVKATAIQKWWRRICENRCYKCGNIYSGTWRCNECEFENWVDFMETHYEDIVEKELEEIYALEDEKKRKRQEKKRAFGLIP